jgi:molybdopterin-biosynthesis enzyme MoeA-like protein
MEAMFDHYADRFGGAAPILSWRRSFRTGESTIADLLVEATESWPDVTVGSYPSFLTDGPEVEIVLKSADAASLNAAVLWLEPQLVARSRP